MSPQYDGTKPWNQAKPRCPACGERMDYNNQHGQLSITCKKILREKVEAGKLIRG